MTQRLTAPYAREILADIKCELFPEWYIKLYAPEEQAGRGDPYLQVVGKSPCSKTGEVVEWTGYKWRVSWHMCKTELICTAFRAYRDAIDHEFRELFKYRGLQIFDPHRDVDALIEMAQADRIDVRRDQLQGA